MSDCEKNLFAGFAGFASFTGTVTPSQTLAELVRIIRACGQDPMTQLAGYLMTDDPTYLPDTAHARSMADRIGRDKLLETLLTFYLAENNGSAETAEGTP